MTSGSDKIVKNLTGEELDSYIKLLVKGLSAERLIKCLLIFDELEISDPKSLRRAWFGYVNNLHPQKVIALDLLASNETIESVANSLNVSEKTINRWVRNIANSIGEGSKFRALEIAKRSGLGKEDGTLKNI